MSPRNLLEDPLWNSIDLGEPIPESPHAVSVALPTWKDIVDYEEQKPHCLNSLKAIYPRFGLNPLVSEISRKAIESEGLKGFNAWPYPNLRSAQKALSHCKTRSKESEAFIKNVLGLQCLITNKTATTYAKEFWQHTGLGASSRLAAIALNKEKNPKKVDSSVAEIEIKKRLGSIYGCEKENIELHPSGMAALNRILSILCYFRPKNACLQLGFPYVDVLKLPQVIFNGSDLLLTHELSKINIEIERRKPSAIIVELPSNPMLKCLDLVRVSKIAHEHGIPIIADDTIGSGVNIDSLPYADIVFSSLTKSFAGKGDILAGCIIISPYSKWAKDFRLALASEPLAPLSSPDIIALEEVSRDVNQRIQRLNISCLELKHKLEKHPLIERVRHPESCQNFKALMRPNAGYGCLLSFEIKGGVSKAKSFYDNLEVCKGPSLGTNFTLVCPYVLLAHYKELDWAHKCGIPSHLIRVSVGLENPEKLWARFEKALAS